METECLVCREIFTEPMEKICGHPVCRVCLQLNSRDHAACPVCKNDNDVSWKRLFYLERYCKNLPWVCECGEKMTHEKRDFHEKKCPLKKIICPMDKCPFTGMPHEIASHLITVHVNYSVKGWAAENTLSKLFRQQCCERFLAAVSLKYDMESSTLHDMGQIYIKSMDSMEPMEE